METTLVNFMGLGEFSLFIWLSYAVAAVVMMALLWRTLRELGEAEKSFETAQKLTSGASLASKKYSLPDSLRQNLEEC